MLSGFSEAEAEKKEFADVSPNGDSIFQIAKQMDHTNQDVVGEPCMCNDEGALTLTGKEKMAMRVQWGSALGAPLCGQPGGHC